MTNGELVNTGAASGLEVWHWHITLYREIERLAAIGESFYPAKGIAGNIRFSHADTVRYARELMAIGAIRETAPMWNYSDLWVGLS